MEKRRRRLFGSMSLFCVPLLFVLTAFHGGFSFGGFSGDGLTPSGFSVALSHQALHSWRFEERKIGSLADKLLVYF